MKRIVLVILALSCFALLVPAAFAADSIGPSRTDARFAPTLRIGCAFDIEEPTLEFSTDRNLLLIRNWDLALPKTGRLYLATELPFKVTDRLIVSLDGDWMFSGSGTEMDADYNGGFGSGTRQWDADGTLHWVSTDLLVSYALIKEAGMIKDLSVIAGLRWDYQSLNFTDPDRAVNIFSSPVDTINFRMQTLTPLAGLSVTFGEFKSGIWGGDLNVRVLAGPVVWGRVDYSEKFGNANFIRFENDLSHGYLVKALADFELLSGKIAPSLDASLSIFAQYTKTNVKGAVDGRSSLGVTPFETSPGDFNAESGVFVMGLAGTLMFDIPGKPAPVTPPPAPEPVIEPKLEPMSYK